VAERTLASEIAGIKEELKTFFQTRVLILRAEAKEKIRTWRSSIVLLALAVVFLISGWFALVFALIALVHAWIVAGSYAWFGGGVIISLLLLAAGVACGQSGYRGIKAAGMKPTRTLKILKQDQEWIQKQARPA
jgi:uncharacterized membrane protein YqjE